MTACVTSARPTEVTDLAGEVRWRAEVAHITTEVPHLPPCLRAEVRVRDGDNVTRTDPRLARKWQKQVTRTAPAAAVKQGAVAPVGGDMERLGCRRQETELDTIKLLPS